MRRNTEFIVAIVCVAVFLSGVGSSSTASADGKDFSGAYEDEGSTIYVLTGPNELFVSYSEKFGKQSCACLARGETSDGGLYRFDASTDFLGTVDVRDYGIIFKLTETPQCCGAGWRGLPRFDADSPEPPQACTVTAPQAHFYAYKRRQNPQQRPAYVMKGDRVDVVPAPGVLAAQFWLGRFVGSKKTTIGLLKKDEVGCAQK